MGEFSNPAGYELWMGRWSERLAPHFVRFSKLPPGARVLDVGSGTGALSRALLAAHPEVIVTGIEPAEDYVAYSWERISDPRASFAPGNALDIPFDDDAFDATLSLLILQELLDPPKALGEMCRVTRRGGQVAASQWNFKTGMPMLSLFWDTVIETVGTEHARRAAANTLDVTYPDDKAMVRLWRESGLVNIKTELQSIDMVFESFEDYWKPFLSGVTETSSYAMTLSEDDRQAVEDSLRNAVAEQSAKGRFTLRAEAWAVKGRVP